MEEEVRNLMEKTVCQVALVIDHTQVQDASIASIRSPVSTCNVATVVVLSDKGDESEREERAKRWLYSHGLVADTAVLYGEAGFQSVLQDESIYALYISVASPTQHTYIMASLQARKHVLLHDTESTPYDKFLEQSACAQATNTFLQFTTMFCNEHHSKHFWDCVSAPHTFGSIRRIEAILSVHVRDLPLIQVPYPILPQHGCIRRLARFAVLVTTLILRGNSHRTCCDPLSAKVTDWVRDDVTGEPVAATCVVEFAGSVTLHCQVEFSRGATRQVLTVQSNTDTFATMTDFVIPHPDGLTNYRVYHKRGCHPCGTEQGTKREEILQGACLDVPRAVPHNVTQWREFHRLCRLVDDTGPQNPEAQRFASASLDTKRVLLALDESYQQQQQSTGSSGGGGNPITIPCKQDVLGTAA